VNERQKSIDIGNASISVNIDAPVVENPEQASKKASTGFVIDPEIINGIAPNIEASSQLPVTIIKPSFNLMDDIDGVCLLLNNIPISKQIIIVIKKALVQ